MSTTTPKQLTLPILRVGGTPRERLLDSHREAASALRLALAALEESAPNGRDYVEGTMCHAVAEHDARMRAVRAVLAEVNAMARSISAGGFAIGVREHATVPA